MPAAQLTAHHMFQAELRRSRRDDVYLPTTMWSADAGQVEVQVVNISPHGFMARVRDEVCQGTCVRLRLPETGPVPATVIWSLGGRIGAEFIDPIDSTNYATLLAALSQPRSDWQFR